MCCTLEAIHVVPQKQTQHKAIIGNPTAFILVEKAVRILISLYRFVIESIVKFTNLFVKMVFPTESLSWLNLGH
jgi:hypothetical protein